MKNILTAKASGNLQALKQARTLANQALGIQSDVKHTKASVSKEQQVQAAKTLAALTAAENKRKNAVKRNTPFCVSDEC